MKLKVITLNCWYYKYTDKILKYLKKLQPDVILLQEVTSGPSLQTDFGVLDGYQRTVESLPEYDHAYAPMWQLPFENHFYNLGVAVFSRFKIRQSIADFYYKELMRIEVFQGSNSFPGLNLSCTLDLGATQIEVISTHFIWSMHPGVSSEQIEAAPLFSQEISSKNALILGGDFNTTDETQIYHTVSRDLIDDRPQNLTNTLHPEIHKLQGSKDLAVDYLFHKGKNISCLSSEVPLIPLSDHLPIVADYEIY